MGRWICRMLLLGLLSTALAQIPTASGIEPSAIALAQTPTETGSETPTTAAATSVPTATATATATAGPTATAWPAATQTPYVVTATPSATPTANAPQTDIYEPNNSAGSAAAVAVPALLEKLNFYPLGDVDYFRFTIKPSQAGLTLTLDTYADLGVDTVISLTAADGTEIAHNDDYSPTEPRSHIAIQAIEGEYLAVVSNRAPTRADFKTYRFEITLIAPSPANAQPTDSPISEPEGAWDQYRGENFSWDSAAQIAIGEEISGLTFGCPVWEQHRPLCAVADFFRIQVKDGTCYTASTGVTPGIDTNLIVYSDQRDSAAPLTGNDDHVQGDFSSAATWCNTYTGEAYVLIGQVGNVAPPPPIGKRTYSLLVDVWVAPAAAPEPTSSPPPDVPLPPIGAAPDPGAGSEPFPIAPPVLPVPPAVPTSALEQTLLGVVIQEIRPDQAAQPTAIPLIAIPLTTMVCFDRNANQSCDIDEGVAGVSVYVTRSDSGDLLGQAITNQDGRAQLTVRANEQAQLTVSVPSFAAIQQVSARSPNSRPIVIKSSANLPALIP